MSIAKLLKIAFLVLLYFNKANASTWNSVAPGIEYIDLKQHYLSPWSHIHVFRIDLKKNVLSLVMAKDLALPHASVVEYAQHSRALLAINGGFFDERLQPLGLRIRNTQPQSTLKLISWWGIFYIKNKKPYLTNIRQFNNSNNRIPIDFAVQSGPRLLINGRIPPLKPGRAERSAIGITKQGKVLLLVTDFTALSTTELAQLMKASPLECIDALNLDGGSSSQLEASLGTFHLRVHGLSNVSDAIIVKPRI